MAHAYETLSCGEYGGVLLLGDTHTVPLFALAARRFAVPVVHLEAGLRSFNAQSVEEGNRRVAGALASLHLAPTELAARMLDAEGVSATRVRVVGNPVTDSLRKFGPRKAPVARAIGRGRHDASRDERRRSRAPPRAGRPHPCARRRARRGAISGASPHPRPPRARRLAARSRDRARGHPRGAAALRRDARGDREQSGDRHRFRRPSGGSGVVRRTRRRAAADDAALGECARRLVIARRRATYLARSTRCGCSRSPTNRNASPRCRVPYGDGHVGPRVASILTHPSTDGLLEINEPDLAAAPPTLAAGRDS